MTEYVLAPEQVRAWRWRAHQLAAEPGSVTDVADLDILDLGVQETGPIGALWSLACRGWSVSEAPEVDLVWAWTLRGAPHAYRRSDLTKVAAATAPYDDADAACRILDAADPMRDNGVSVLEALSRLATLQRDVVREASGKGQVSTALSGQVPAYLLRWCERCGAEHPLDMPFRLAALHGGLELEMQASPILHRARGIRPQRFARRRRDARLDPLRGYLRFFAPARLVDAAAHLGTERAAVAEAWPKDVVRVKVTGLPGVRHVLASDIDSLVATPSQPESRGVVRLLGPFDPYLQLRDRELLVPDASRRHSLWRSLGRPGAVVRDGEVLGVWRPRSTGQRLTLRLELWAAVTAAVRAAIEQEAERLAAHRAQKLAAVTEDL